MSVPERDAAEWVLRAQSDLLNIDNNLKCAKIPWDTMVFHAQQLCEKLLKAFLVKEGHIAPRTHDLGLLLNMCPKVGSQDPSLAADMDKLMLLFGSRYPDTKLPSETEGRDAIATAKRLMSIVSPMVGHPP
jgi:HEPN domain-containing protein